MLIRECPQNKRSRMSYIVIREHTVLRSCNISPSETAARDKVKELRLKKFLIVVGAIFLSSRREDEHLQFQENPFSRLGKKYEKITAFENDISP